MSAFKALVIEDIANVALSITSVLQDLGLEVSVADDIQKARQLIDASQSGGFLVYTLDILLKGNYGLTLLTRYPNTLTRSNTLIITSWEDRFRAELETLGYKYIDKNSLDDRPYETLIEIILSLPAVENAGISPPWAKGK